MNKKYIFLVFVTSLSLFSCYGRETEPDLSLLLPTEYKTMKISNNEQKKIIINECSGITDEIDSKYIKQSFCYEQTVGKDEFIWIINPYVYKKPIYEITLIKKTSEKPELLVSYGSQLIWGDRHIFLQINNAMIVKGKDKAKGFIIFRNYAEIQYKSSFIEDGYTIKKCKNQYAGTSSGTFYRFSEEPESFNYFEMFSINAPDENEWSPDYLQSSDFLWDEKNPLKYSLCNAFDQDPATSFVENTEDDLMNIEAGFNGLSKKILIINGYAKNNELYKKNNQVTEIASEFISDNEISTTLTEKNKRFALKENEMNVQILDFVSNGFMIVSKIKKGTSFNDTCLAELNFFSEEDGWIFGDLDE